ncbi:Kunitz/Bovine pancreatic trypsin inhibitor domain protein, partial [Cooperia oncophora]
DLSTLHRQKHFKDLCDEPLNPKLEEDCNNENWELKWYFNKVRGACKSFWYGGCETKARNFFGDVKSCRTTCGHKYPPPEEALNPQFLRDPSLILKAKIATPATTSTPFWSEPTSPELLDSSVVTTVPASSEATTGFVRNVDAAPPTALRTTTEKNRENVPSIQSPTQEKVIMDICDKGFDPKWDEDCDNDNWIIRAYFEPKKNGCKRIWWGGCVTDNKNLWSSMAECQRACAHKIEPLSVPPEPQNRASEVTTSTKGTTAYPMSSMSL